MFAFIEKYIIYILCAALVAVAVLGGIQYARVLHAQTTIAKQAADLLSKDKTIAELNGQVAQYQANIAAAKKAQEAIQAVYNSTADQLAEARKITGTCVIGGLDETRIDSFSARFNNHGVLQLVSKTDSGAAAGNKAVPKTATANNGNPGKQRYSLNQIIENYVTLIGYTLELEKGTVACYEQGD